MTVRPGMWRDRRGAGIAEYALLLLIVVIVGALAFKFVGGGVKHAGNKTNEQFAGGEGANGPGAGGNGSAGDKSKAGDKKAGDKTTGQGQEGTSVQTAGQGGAAAGAGGGGGGGGTAQAGQNGQGGGGAAEDEQGGGRRSTPLWKIIGGVFVLLFAAGGYFAFRKQKSEG
ncbi:MAG TPA: hypothetical protein VLM85_04305 [Polyangiaceae bacterium]|nr:hypothetical protein [Polyangiaceae bacterium]